MKWLAGMFPNSTTHPWTIKSKYEMMKHHSSNGKLYTGVFAKSCSQIFLDTMVYRKNKATLILCGLEGWLYFHYIQEINSYLQRHLELSTVTKKYMVSFFFFAFRLFWGEGHFLFNHAVIIYIQSVCSHITITTTKGNRCK